MLRAAAAACRRTAVCAELVECPSQLALWENLGCATARRCSQARHFSGPVPKPDPENNPEPTDRVTRLVDEIEDLTVKEFVWFNKILQERLGISDAELMGMPMGGMQMQAAPVAAETAEAPKEEKTAFDVIIEGYEAPAKIKIIKEVRALVPGLGLKEGKELVRVAASGLRFRCRLPRACKRHRSLF